MLRHMTRTLSLAAGLLLYAGTIPVCSASSEHLHPYDAQIRAFVDDPLIVAIRGAMDRSFGCGLSNDWRFHPIRVHRELRSLRDRQRPTGQLSPPLQVQVRCANHTVVRSLTIEFGPTLVDENDRHLPFDLSQIRELRFEAQDNHTVFPARLPNRVFDEAVAVERIRAYPFWREFHEIVATLSEASCQAPSDQPVFFRRGSPGESVPGRDTGRRFTTAALCPSPASPGDSPGFALEGSYYEARDFVLARRIRSLGGAWD